MLSSLLPKPKHVEEVSIDFHQSKRPLSDNRILISVEGSNTGDIQDEPILNATRSIVDGPTENKKSIIQGRTPRKTRIQATHEDTIPLKVRYPNMKHYFPRYTLETSPDASLRSCLEETKAVFQNIVESKLGNSDERNKESGKKYVSFSGVERDNGNEIDEKIIEISDLREDPMLPPKFKLRKNRHKEPSPPPPVLRKKPTVNITREEKEKWRIPAALSNWKNNQGFTIPLEKRVKVANAGRETDIYDEESLLRLANLASALEAADSEAREEIKIRNRMIADLTAKEQRKKRDRLEEIVNATRNERGHPELSHERNEQHKRQRI